MSVLLLIQIAYSVNITDLVKLPMKSNYYFLSSVLSTLHLIVRHIVTYIPYGKYLGHGTSYIRGFIKEHVFYSLVLWQPKMEHNLYGTNLHNMPPILLLQTYIRMNVIIPVTKYSIHNFPILYKMYTTHIFQIDVVTYTLYVLSRYHRNLLLL